MNQIQRIIYNGIHWARPHGRPDKMPIRVAVENAPEKVQIRGPQMHDASGRLISSEK